MISDNKNVSPRQASGCGGGKVQKKLNEMHRIVNKQIYEIEAMINSVYYGKVVESHSETRINKDFNFGYDQNNSLTSTSGHSSSSNLREVSDTQIQFMQSKISSIQVYFDDLKQYYHNNKDDLESTSQSSNSSKKTSSDLQFYWNKKVEQLGTKIGTLPNALQRALRNNQKIMQQQQREEQRSVYGQQYGLKNRGAEGRRRVQQISTENDSLTRSQQIVADISSSGGNILTSLEAQQQTLRNVGHKTAEMLNQLGLSDNILTLIERRGKADLMIFFALCALTLFFIYVLFYYVKPIMSLSYILGYGGEAANGSESIVMEPPVEGAVQ